MATTLNTTNPFDQYNQSQTGMSVDLAKANETQTSPNTSGVGFGQYVPTSDAGRAQIGLPPLPKAPSVIASTTTPVQDTSGNQAGVANVNAAAQTQEEAALAKQQADNAATLASINDMVKNMGSKTQEELTAIEQAGTQAGSAYDPLIQQAQVDKTKGEGKAVVGAGRRGGFMRLRDVGVGAVEPTQGGTWFGAGGRLEDLKSAYDRNINQLEIAKTNAIEAAKSAKETAIRTGKKEDISMALDLYRAASDAASEAQKLYNEKLDRIAAGNKAERDAMEADRKFALDVAQFEVGQDRFERTQAVAEGWLSRSLTEDQKKTAQQNIIDMANSGIPLKDISEEKRTELEARAGYEPASFEAIYQNALDEAAYGDKMDLLKMQQLQASISKSQRSGSGTGGSGTKLTGFDADLDQAANLIIRAEKAGGGKSDPTSYWNMVKSLGEASGLSEADVDSMLINAINTKKGITNNYQEQSAVSDFEVPAPESNDLLSKFNVEKQRMITGGYDDKNATYYAQQALLRQGYSLTEIKKATGNIIDKLSANLGMFD
jgi:hypothetical protein